MSLPALQKQGGPEDVEDGEGEVSVDVIDGGEGVEQQAQHSGSYQRYRVEPQEREVEGDLHAKVLVDLICGVRNTFVDSFQ